MPVDPSVLGPATLAMSTGVGAFYQFLPRLSEVRQGNPASNPQLAADVRVGEVAAVALAVGVGAVASSLTGSPTPAIVALIVGAVLVVIYETTLRAGTPALERNPA